MTTFLQLPRCMSMEQWNSSNTVIKQRQRNLSAPSQIQEINKSNQNKFTQKKKAPAQVLHHEALEGCTLKRHSEIIQTHLIFKTAVKLRRTKATAREREREICKEKIFWPVDHMRRIPFLQLVPFTHKIKFQFVPNCSNFRFKVAWAAQHIFKVRGEGRSHFWKESQKLRQRMGFNYCSVWAKISCKFKRARIKQTTFDCKPNRKKQFFITL